MFKIKKSMVNGFENDKNAIYDEFDIELKQVEFEIIPYQRVCKTLQ
jgi:hypothetical protein